MRKIEIGNGKYCIGYNGHGPSGPPYVTDLVDCCESPQSHGDWFYPNGNIVQFDGFPLNAVFRANRGQNEIRNGRQFYGSVCLWHRYS